MCLQMKTIAYIGTYQNGGGQGIYAAEWHADGTLGVPALAAEAENPSYLALTADGGALFAVLENERGSVASYAVERGGALTETARVPSGGAYPCHFCLSPDGHALYVANYGTGFVGGVSDAPLAVFPVGRDVATGRPAVGACQRTATHAGHGAHPVRQTCPHTHFVTFLPSGQLAAVDLGMDLIFTYAPAPGGALYEAWQSRLFPGCGPRHLAIHPRAGTAYCVDELSGDLTRFALTPQGGFDPLDYHRTAPADFTGENLPAAVKLSPDGRLLAVSGRGFDGIALYAVARDGALGAPAFFPCGGKGPRDLAFSPDGRFLYAANERSGDITAFAVQNGALTPLGTAARVSAPVCVVFAQAAD